MISILLAVTNRFGGGDSPDALGGQLTRIVWRGLPWAIPGFIFGGWWGLLCGLTAVLGWYQAPFNFRHSAYMNTRNLREIAMMCLIGAIRGFWAASPLFVMSCWFGLFPALGGLLFVLGGAFYGVLYWLGNKLQNKITVTWKIWNKVFLAPDDGLSEITSGAGFGLPIDVYLLKAIICLML